MRGHAWQGACVAGVCMTAVCMAGGMHGRGRGMHGRGACVVEWCTWQGACMAGGMHGRGHAWQLGECMAGETATAADVMHPTGMHSCLTYDIISTIAAHHTGIMLCIILDEITCQE